MSRTDDEDLHYYIDSFSRSMMKKGIKVASDRITVRLCRKTYNSLIDRYLLDNPDERSATSAVNARLKALMKRYMMSREFCQEISVRVCRDLTEGPKCSAQSICVPLEREWYMTWKSQLASGMVSSVLLAIARWELDRLNKLQEKSVNCLDVA